MYARARSVFASGTNDIWIAAGSVHHFDGSHWEQFAGLQGEGNANRIWGDRSQNLWFVGDGGSITHFNGISWRRVASGTDVDLLDVWGTSDGSVVWACGYRDFKPTVLLRIVNGICEKVYEDQAHLSSFREDSLSGAIQSVWTNRLDRIYVLSGLELYEAPYATRGQAVPRWKSGYPETWASRCLRGNDANDLIAVGYQARVWHFNGASWKNYSQLVNPLDELYSVAMKGNQIVAVGQRYYNGIRNFGIVYQGRR